MGKAPMVPFVLALIGAIILLASVAVGWYAWSFSASGSGSGISYSSTLTETLYPGDKVVTASSSTCTGSSYCSSISSSQSNSTTYQKLMLNNTGNLYGAAEGLVIAGGIAGLLGAILLMVSGSKPSFRKIFLALGVIALILAIAAPMALLAAQPGAIHSDATSHGGTISGSGPWSSFFGSCSGTACGNNTPQNSSATWGPSVGWYLSIVGFVLFLVALLMGWRAKPMAAAAAPAMPAPAMPEASAPSEPAQMAPPGTA